MVRTFHNGVGSSKLGYPGRVSVNRVALIVLKLCNSCRKQILFCAWLLRHIFMQLTQLWVTFKMLEDFEDVFAEFDNEAPKRPSMDKRERWALKLFEKWLLTEKTTSESNVPQQSSSHFSVGRLDLDDNNSRSEGIHTSLLESTYEQLDKLLSSFIMDISNQRTGKRLYSPETIRQLVMSLQRFLRVNGRHVSLLTDPTFNQLQNCVALESTELFSEKDVHCKYKAIISREVERELWVKSILSTTNAYSLLNTLVYLIGVNFGITSGNQLRKCLFKGGPILFITDSGIDFVRYTPKLKRKSVTDIPKHLDVYEESGQDQQSLVSVFKTYQSKW